MPDFNAEPFRMGAFEQIANYRGGRGGRAEVFQIGVRLANSGRIFEKDASAGNTCYFLRTFANKDSQPELTEWSIESGEYRIGRSVQAGSNPTFEFKTPSGVIKLTGRRLRKIAADFDFGLINWLLDLALREEPELPIREDAIQREIQGIKPNEQEREVLHLIVRGLFGSLSGSVYASSPIRSQPHRTYELFKDTPHPEGQHIPMILSKIYGHQEWVIMKDSLEGFGRASGLFDKVQIKRLGHQASSPFQILIKIKGPPFNLVDVGYGVSQALPLVVEMLQSQKTVFLLQQPEVHLHPKAQAELGSFVASLVKTHKHRFLIETHSDYLIDRVRMDIRDKKSLSPGDVTILFFQRVGTDVEIHPLRLDENGNIQSAPIGYRQFFLKEERRYLRG